MRVAFRTRNLDLDDDVRAHAERSILNALGRLERGIERVEVRLGDLNGPRGGLDKSCRLDALLVRGETLHVEDVDRDLHAAVDRAAERLGRSVTRAIARRRAHGTGTPRRAGRAPRDRSSKRSSAPVRD